MHSQMVRPQDHDHTVGEGEEEHHHEKKSVLKKVKAKAKKLKDTLKLHGHDQGQDYQVHETPDDHDLDEEDDEMADDPAIHGVSGLHTTLVGNSVPEQVGNQSDTRNYYGSSESAMEEQEPHLQRTNQLKSFSPLQEDEGNRVDVERISGIKEKPYTPVSSPAPLKAGIVEQPKAVDPIGGFSEEQDAIRGQPEISKKNSLKFDEDPYAPDKFGTQHHSPTNYETKVNDPTGQGGEEIESSSIVQQLGQMGISDKPKPKPGEFNSVCHDQFSPESSPPVPISTPENPQSNFSEQVSPTQSSYTGKISAATSAIADKAISAKNVVASKLGYGNEGESQAKGTSVAPLEYGKKIAATVTEKLTPVYGKVVETGSNLRSKAQGSYKSNETERETETVVEGQDKGVSVKGFLSEKLMPGEEDRALSAVISGAWNKQKGLGEERRVGEVTESEEVRRRLGGGGEEEAVAGGGVVGKIKEVVGSLMGKGAGNRVSEQPTSIGNERFVGSESGETGERRLQESGN